MKLNLRYQKSMVPIAVLALAAWLAPRAAACGSPNQLTQRVLPGMWSLPPMPDQGAGAGPATSSSTDVALPPITGLWKTVMVSGGAVIMVGFDTWHSDGTELALDGLFAPASGNVCPGVWEKTGPGTYNTVHPAFEYDPAGINVIAIFIERMHVTISSDGNSFQGSFRWDSYDFQGNLLPGSIGGAVTGTRIAVGAPFPFPFPLG